MHQRSAFAVDDQGDRDLASDGVSRYGAYLQQKRHIFHSDGPDTAPTTDPVEFAVAAWTIAAPPIMAPGYLTTHGRILDTTVHRDDQHRTALSVHVAIPPPLIVTLTMHSPRQGWARQTWPHRWHDPDDNHRVTVLNTLTVRIPLDPHRLPAPRYRCGVPDTDTAKQALAAICDLLNTELDELLAALDTPNRAMPAPDRFGVIR